MTWRRNDREYDVEIEDAIATLLENAELDVSERAIRSLGIERLDNVFHASAFPGSNGGEKIQNAWDAANSATGNNGVIIGPKGPDNPPSAPESDVWEITTHLDPEGYDGTHLIGQGMPLLFLADGAEDDIIRTAKDGSAVTTRDVHIEGIRFHGNRANNTTSGRWSDTATIKGLNGIRAINCEHWTVENCIFQNVTRFGFQAKLSHHITVRDCWSENCGDDGFTASNEYFNSQDLSNITFERVYGFNCDDQGIEIEDGSQDIIIRDSWFEGNANLGGTVKSHVNNEYTGDEQPCNNVTWENCYFVNNTEGGLGISGSVLGEAHNHTVRGCTFRGNNGGYDLRFGKTTFAGTTYPVRDITVKDCSFEVDGTVAAIRADPEADLIDVTIDGAHIDVIDTATAVYGIAFRKALSIDGLTISAHINAPGTDYGIDIVTQTGPINDLTIGPDTVVKNSNGVGLRIQVDSYPITNYQILGGTYKNNGQDTGLADTQRVGVRLWGGSGGTDLNGGRVTNVRAFDDQETKTQTYGILPQTDYALFTSNDLRGNALGAYNYEPLGVSIRDGRGFNAGDPNTGGDWNGENTRAEEHNVVVEDTTNNILYMSVGGSYAAIDTQ